ncbi:MAG: DUF3187 family protein [Candidatus Omnitrophota bacterium]
MKNKISTIVAFFVFLLTAHSSQPTAIFAEENKYQAVGPLNVRNQMPLYLFYMSPTLDKAQTLKKGKIRVDASYHVSNIVVHQRPWPGQQFGGVTEKDREWWVYVDTEVNRVDANLSYGILDDMEISLDMPYYIFSGGYLDSFIENFERSFSFIKTPNAREETEKYNYEYEIRNKGNPYIFSTSEANDFGEVSAYLKYKILDENKWVPTASLRAAVKFPTAKDELLGSKKFDYAAGILLDKSLFKRFFVFLNMNYIFVDKPDILSNLDVFKKEMLHGALGLEYFLTDKTSMLFQFTANTTVYDGGVPATDHDPGVLTLGFNHNFNDKISWQIAIDENTNGAAPDFGVFTSLKIKN